MDTFTIDNDIILQPEIKVTKGSTLEIRQINIEKNENDIFIHCFTDKKGGYLRLSEAPNEIKQKLLQIKPILVDVCKWIIQNK